MLFAVAVTLMVPPKVVVRSPTAVCVTPVPPVRLRFPVVDDITLFAVSRPAVFRVTEPEPFAVTTLSTVRADASTSILILPFPEMVRTPVLPMINPSVSCTKMSPLVLLVATSVPRVVSISAAPVAPMPVPAMSVAVPDVVMFAVSALVMSVIAPAVAVMLIALLVVVIAPSLTFVPARSVT